MTPQDLKFEDIVVGQKVRLDRTWTEEDLQNFALLSGDYNPLHLDEEYAQTTKFGKRLVYGALVSSLCSRLVGMYIPGKRCLFLSQSLTFKHPVFIGDTTTLEGEVVATSITTRIVTIKVTYTVHDQVVIEGELKAQVL